MIITNNAYLILGLSSDSDEKLLNKRYKEILKILDIDEVPEYENDFSFIDYKKIRTAEAVKGAFHELSNQRKRLYQDFFWFQIVTGKDEKLYKQLCKGDVIESIEGRGELYQTTGKFHYLKNRVIALLLSFENQNKFDDLDFSGDGPEIVRALHECIESDKFWKEFLNIVNLSAETPISDNEISKFRSEISQYLAEEFFDLSEELKAPKLYVEFNKVFGVNAKELDDNENVTKPLSVIEKNSKKIKELDLGSDLDEIIDLINEIEDEVKKLTKVGLQKNPKIIKVIDDVSLQIRGLGIALVNDYDDKEGALDFINEALSLKPSTTISQKLNKDINDIKGMEAHSSAIEKLADMVKRGKELRDNGNHQKAEEQYQVIINYIEGELKDTFHLNSHYLSKFKEKVKIQVSAIYPGIPEYQLNSILGEIDKVNGFIKDGGGFHWGDDLNVGYLSPEEGLLYFFYIDAVAKVAMEEKLKSLQNRIKEQKREQRTEGCWSWIIRIVIMLIIAAVAN